VEHVDWSHLLCSTCFRALVSTQSEFYFLIIHFQSRELSFIKSSDFSWIIRDQPARGRSSVSLSRMKLLAWREEGQSSWPKTIQKRIAKSIFNFSQLSLVHFWFFTLELFVRRKSTILRATALNGAHWPNVCKHFKCLTKNSSRYFLTDREQKQYWRRSYDANIA
jgi:hypothetical protein